MPTPVDADLIAAYRGVSPSILGHWHRLRFMDVGIKPVRPGTFLVGPAFTVRAPYGDLSALHAVREEARPGDVVVVDQVGEAAHACFGEFRALHSIRAGHAGWVVDGSVTDVLELRAMGYPVFTRHVSPLVAKKLDVDGATGVPISCGGIAVHPGDLIVGDDNGVCVLDPDEARALLPKVREVLAKEAGWREGFAEEYRRFAGG